VRRRRRAEFIWRIETGWHVALRGEGATRDCFAELWARRLQSYRLR
jgi:hypothetical protein